MLHTTKYNYVRRNIRIPSWAITYPAITQTFGNRRYARVLKKMKHICIRNRVEPISPFIRGNKSAIDIDIGFVSMWRSTRIGIPRGNLNRGRWTEVCIWNGAWIQVRDKGRLPTLQLIARKDREISRCPCIHWHRAALRGLSVIAYIERPAVQWALRHIVNPAEHRPFDYVSLSSGVTRTKRIAPTRRDE